LVQFGNTPKALANVSPGLERQRQPWVDVKKYWLTLKGFGGHEPFQVRLHSINRNFGFGSVWKYAEGVG
jgi:hypothetical protein